MSEWVTEKLRKNLYISLLGDMDGETFFVLHSDRDEPNRSAIAVMDLDAADRLKRFVEKNR